MKLTLIIVGVIVAAIGIASITGKLHVKQDEEVAKIGGLSASVEKDKTAPQWLGIAAIVVGGVMVLGGALKKS